MEDKFNDKIKAVLSGSRQEHASYNTARSELRRLGRKYKPAEKKGVRWYESAFYRGGWETGLLCLISLSG